MKPFEFTVINPVNGSRGFLKVYELNQKAAIKVANKRAKYLSLVLIY
jgi:hypothetical protein